MRVYTPYKIFLKTMILFVMMLSSGIALSSGSSSDAYRELEEGLENSQASRAVSSEVPREDSSADALSRGLPCRQFFSPILTERLRQNVSVNSIHALEKVMEGMSNAAKILTGVAFSKVKEDQLQEFTEAVYDLTKKMDDGLEKGLSIQELANVPKEDWGLFVESAKELIALTSLPDYYNPNNSKLQGSLKKLQQERMAMLSVVYTQSSITQFQDFIKVYKELSSVLGWQDRTYIFTFDAVSSLSPEYWTETFVESIRYLCTHINFLEYEGKIRSVHVALIEALGVVNIEFFTEPFMHIITPLVEAVINADFSAHDEDLKNRLSTSMKNILRRIQQNISVDRLTEEFVNVAIPFMKNISLEEKLAFLESFGRIPEQHVEQFMHIVQSFSQAYSGANKRILLNTLSKQSTKEDLDIFEVCLEEFTPQNKVEIAKALSQMSQDGLSSLFLEIISSLPKKSEAEKFNAIKSLVQIRDQGGFFQFYKMYHEIIDKGEGSLDAQERLFKSLIKTFEMLDGKHDFIAKVGEAYQIVIHQENREVFQNHLILNALTSLLKMLPEGFNLNLFAQAIKIQASQEQSIDGQEIAKMIRNYRIKSEKPHKNSAQKQETRGKKGKRGKKVQKSAQGNTYADTNAIMAALEELDDGTGTGEFLQTLVQTARDLHLFIKKEKENKIVDCIRFLKGKSLEEIQVLPRVLEIWGIEEHSVVLEELHAYYQNWKELCQLASSDDVQSLVLGAQIMLPDSASSSNIVDLIRYVIEEEKEDLSDSIKMLSSYRDLSKKTLRNIKSATKKLLSGGSSMREAASVFYCLRSTYISLDKSVFPFNSIVRNAETLRNLNHPTSNIIKILETLRKIPQRATHHFMKKIIEQGIWSEKENRIEEIMELIIKDICSYDTSVCQLGFEDMGSTSVAQEVRDSVQEIERRRRRKQELKQARSYDPSVSGEKRESQDSFSESSGEDAEEMHAEQDREKKILSNDSYDTLLNIFKENPQGPGAWKQIKSKDIKDLFRELGGNVHEGQGKGSHSKLNLPYGSKGGAFILPNENDISMRVKQTLRAFFEEHAIALDIYMSRKEARESLPYAGASSDVIGPSSSSSGSASSSVSSRGADASDATDSDSHVSSDLEEQQK